MKQIPDRTKWTYIRFALACAFCVLQVAAQTPSGPKVELSLIVTDKANKPVNTITKDEIQVKEGKVEQVVLSVEHDDRPIDYGLVMDASKSLMKLSAAALEAARLIIANKRPDDEIFIEQFISSDKIIRVEDFTSDGNALMESLKTIKLDGGQSAVIDGIYMGAEHVAKHNKKSEGRRRKALIVITDGEDRLSFYKEEQLIKLLREEGIQVFALGLVLDLDRDGGFIRISPRDKAEKLLNTVADETGGRAFFPRDKKELIEATAQMINHVRAQFRITYQSTSVPLKKGFHKVDVKLIAPSDEKRKAIVPRGYFVAPKDVPAKAKEQKSS